MKIAFTYTDFVSSSGHHARIWQTPSEAFWGLWTHFPVVNPRFININYQINKTDRLPNLSRVGWPTEHELELVILQISFSLNAYVYSNHSQRIQSIMLLTLAQTSWIWSYVTSCRVAIKNALSSYDRTRFSLKNDKILSKYNRRNSIVCYIPQFFKIGFWIVKK